jgi:hypothetical protein
MPQLPSPTQLPRAQPPPLAQSSPHSLPPFSTAESYATQMSPAPLYFSHPASLQPSFTSMGGLSPASYPLSYSVPAGGPTDLKPDAGMYYAQQSPSRNQPQYDVSMYMAQPPAFPMPQFQQPPFQQPFGQTW